MFEKEAEEYAEKTSSLAIKKFNPLEPKLLSIGFQDGAEFGYNKANEWHYVKDGDLPKDNDEKLCFYEKGKVVARYDSEYGCWETGFNNIVTTFSSSILIAWKEIVLPKEDE